MPKYFAAGGRSGRRHVDVGEPFAEGVAGTIHRVIGERGHIVKLYKDRRQLQEYETKLAAMLSEPPNLAAFTKGGRPYVQIAWPQEVVLDANGSFRGFMMPEIDTQASTALENMLQKSARKNKRLPEFYGARVLLAANLAALMAELHTLGHYMIDMKPVNMRCYPDAGYMAILDTDGFSINASPRIPAHDFSDEYIAPEAHGKRPDELGLPQDLFALSVIIFRLLNNGIHPYQGSDDGTFPTSIQDRIFARLYAYGTTSHGGIKPSFSTIHKYLEPNTRALFDRSFDGPPWSRPTAADWATHLQDLISSKSLRRCAVNPAEHAHFSRGCGLCDLEKRPVPRAHIAPVFRGVHTVPAPTGTTAPGHPINSPIAVAPNAPITSTKWRWITLLVTLLLFFIIGWGIIANNTEVERANARAAARAEVRQAEVQQNAIDEAQRANAFRERAARSKSPHSVLFRISPHDRISWADNIVVTDTGLCEHTAERDVDDINQVWFGNVGEVSKYAAFGGVVLYSRHGYGGYSSTFLSVSETDRLYQALSDAFAAWRSQYGDIPDAILNEGTNGASLACNI